MTAVGRAGGPDLRLNVLANYCGKLWSIASVYVFVPIYIHLLGIGAYGLIAFYSIALAILYIADAGLSSSFAREAAREADRSRLRALLASTECTLLAILTLAGLAMAGGAAFIAAHWLKGGTAVDAQTTTQCLRLMPLALVPQIAISLYFGGLMGLQRQVTANALITVFGLTRSGLVVLPLLWLPDPRVFFAWQAASSWAFLFVIRGVLRQQLGLAAIGADRFSWPALRPMLGYASGMFAMSLIAGINSQLDRVVVSSLRPLDEFAWYTLAATLAQVPSIATLPIASALLPRFTELVARRKYVELRALYELHSYVIASVAAASAGALLFFASDIATLWMSNRALPAEFPTVTRILAVGGLFLALQLAPFQLSLANGHNRTNIKLGMWVLFVTVPMQIVLTAHYGLPGAAVPWLLLNLFAFAYLGIVLNQRFNPGHLAAWFLRCSLAPLAIALAMLAAARIAADAVNAGALEACIIAAITAATAVGVCYALRRHFLRPLVP